MYADIASASSVIKTASDLAALILNTKVNQAVRDKAIELQSVIISLQSTIFSIQAQYQEALAERDRLKQELESTKNWEVEAAKYELTQVAPGVFVFMTKATQQEAQTGMKLDYWLCAHCFEKKQKSILQKGMFVGGGYLFCCANCKTDIIAPEKPREQGRVFRA